VGGGPGGGERRLVSEILTPVPEKAQAPLHLVAPDKGSEGDEVRKKDGGNLMKSPHFRIRKKNVGRH